MGGVSSRSPASRRLHTAVSSSGRTLPLLRSISGLALALLAEGHRAGRHSLETFFSNKEQLVAVFALVSTQVALLYQAVDRFADCARARARQRAEMLHASRLDVTGRRPNQCIDQASLTHFERETRQALDYNLAGIIR